MKTKNKRKLAKEARIILAKKSAEAYKKAKEAVINEKIKCRTVRDAMRYFMQEWSEISHPGLLSIACEAVGGNPSSSWDIGASLLLLLSSAHIHDDIIDKTRIKGGKLTVYGKFDEDIALLVGDAFLFKGLLLLHQACNKLPEEKKEKILELTKTAFFEIGCGEVKEVIERRGDTPSVKECLKYMKMRAKVAEAAMRIGALIGNGSEEEIEALGRYGRILGLLSAIREEFINVFEPDELRNRYKHEYLPLPILYALQNEQKRQQIINVLQKKRITEKDAYALVDLIMESKEVQRLTRYMHSLTKKGHVLISAVKNNRAILEVFIDSTVEDI